MDKREEELGFAPQRERIYNKLLPYTGDIDVESNEAFAEIKDNLGKAVALRDLKYGAAHWSAILARYIRIYGMKFSKQDHIALIKLLYELVVIPDLELSLVQKFAPKLTSLLKKTELLSREDLCLPWRPLYELIESVAYSPYEPHGLQLFPPNIENVLKNLIKHCRPYFSVESTQEMLDEWRPLLCPYDVSNMKAIHYLEYFLPTNLPPSQQDRGFKLWFEEFMNMWDSFHNVPPYESGFVNLFARLADDNIGYVDWSPYVAKIFNRFLRSFNLPVGTRSLRVGRSNNTYEINAAVLWIVAMLGGGSDVQEYVDKMFKTLQSFYHPSNLGKWNVKLSGLLMAFPRMFVRRIHKERYKKPSWENQVPDSHKLTETDITRFVESMKPVVFVSMFSKYGSQDSAIALRHLSNMRPEIIIPTLMEKMYPALENLTEPHRLIACMNCIVAVARPMLYARKWYPEGRTHLLPLLNLSLPGIDPNDFKKCLVTFQMISTFVTLVPIVDCSEAVFVRDDLTEIERELCSATAQFEDFVLQFLDRIFALVENSAQEHIHGDVTRLNPEQTMLEVGLASTVTSVLQQCSTPIFKSALSRIHSFVTNSVYESRVGGRFAANLCRAAAKVEPEMTITSFLPHFCSNIKNLMKNHEDLVNEEQLDDSFLWNLLMLPQLVRCNGVVLLPYKSELLEVLKLTLHLKCIQGYEMAGQLLRYLLRALTLVYPLDYKSIAESLNRPVSEYLAIWDWACPGDIHNLGMKWHVPSKEELDFASEIMSEILGPELESIKSITPDNQMDREVLLRRLNVILECILGAGSLMPMWKDNPVDLKLSQVPFTYQTFTFMTKGVDISLNGQNVRKAIVEAVRPLMSHMMATCEDDTKGLFRLIRIYESILLFYGAQKGDFDARWKSFHAVKQALEDKMRRKKMHIRALLVDRIQLQQELRMLNSCSRLYTERHRDMLFDLLTLSMSRYRELKMLNGYDRTFTTLHRDLLADLVTLSTSSYRQVRKKAQGVLFQAFTNRPYTPKCVLPSIIQNLKDPNTPEHQFKGTLYIVLGSGKSSISTLRSWQILGSLWPALVQAQHSEKPSILKVIDEIINKLAKNLESAAVKIKTSAGALKAVEELLKPRVPMSKQPALTSEELTTAAAREDQDNSQELQYYLNLVEELVTLIEGGNLTWKFSQIGMEMLSLCLREDVTLPAKAVQLFVKGMVHDSLYIRKLATGSVSAILKQQKRKHKMVSVDPVKLSGATLVNNVMPPGERADNSWILYDKDTIPDTKEKWEKTIFVEKTHWGYYCWPKDMKVYADVEEQPKLDRSREELSEPERVIYDSLISVDYVKKFLDFLSLEEQKRKDKFRRKHMTLFKGLFRNYGDAFLEVFKTHIERLMSDTSHDTHDSSQRCAMEILSGIIRGSKHWPYDKVASLWSWCLPLLRKALNSITVETQDDWGTFFTVVSESRDPRKLHWLFELIMDNPLNGEGGSFGDSSRLFAAQSALYQQEWRVPKLLHRLLEYLQPHLSHQYKNVRDRVGSLLSSIFLFDYKVSPQCQTTSPDCRQFMEQVIPQLEGLKYTVMEESVAGNFSKNGQVNSVLNQKSNEEEEEAMEVDDNDKEDLERKTAIRLCKTVMKMIINNQNKTFQSAPPEIFPLLSIMCTLESETKDDELKSDCSLALSCFSQALVQPDVMPRAIQVVQEVIGLQSWHARVAVLGYIQVMVFCNFFTLHCPHYITQVRDIVLQLICDDQLEVREMAAITLSGLLHCGFLEMDKDMLDHFEQLSRTKVKKRKRLADTDNIPLEALIKRHAGVLGLGAFVQAYPYDVPDFMPQILMDLGNHVNDPQPIQMTVKKALSDFRRTHHDNWHDHKQMFTDDQLVVLTDLLVSPTYYA